MTASTAPGKKDEIREVCGSATPPRLRRLLERGLIAESGLQMLAEAACCETQSYSTTALGERSVITSDLSAISEVARTSHGCSAGFARVRKPERARRAEGGRNGA